MSPSCREQDTPWFSRTSVGWTLLLQELALLTARARRSQADAEIALITREERPLAVFGTQPSDFTAEEAEYTALCAEVRISCTYGTLLCLLIRDL